MNATLLSLLTGLVSGAITAVVTYFATLSKVRLDLTIEYDKELHKDRLNAYKELWPELKPLARYSPEKAPTYQIVLEVSSKMRDWYFTNSNGIYLSANSRNTYFALKKVMQDIIDNVKLQNNSSADLNSDWVKPIHKSATALRESLSNDIGSRKRPFL